MKLSYKDYEMVDNYLNWLNHQCFKKKAELPLKKLSKEELQEKVAELNDEAHIINILRCALEEAI